MFYYLLIGIIVTISVLFAYIDDPLDSPIWAVAILTIIAWPIVIIYFIYALFVECNYNRVNK